MVRDFGKTFHPKRDALEATWQAVTATPTTLVAVADLGGGDVVGYVLAHVRASFLANGLAAWVEEIAVAANHRRAGIGRELMTHAEDWGRSAGATHLALASRRSGAFYQALGYDDSAVYYTRALG